MHPRHGDSSVSSSTLSTGECSRFASQSTAYRKKCTGKKDQGKDSNGVHGRAVSGSFMGNVNVDGIVLLRDKVVYLKRHKDAT